MPKYSLVNDYKALLKIGPVKTKEMTEKGGKLFTTNC